MNQYAKESKYFKQGIEASNIECMYNYAKMLFLGRGCIKNDKKAIKYFNQSKDLGFKKSEFFFKGFEAMKKINDFSKLPTDTQWVLISNIIKNGRYYNFQGVFIQSQKTQLLFFNKSLK